MLVLNHPQYVQLSVVRFSVAYLVARSTVNARLAQLSFKGIVAA